MALYKVTVKCSSGTSNGVRFEKGMSVEVVSSTDPISSNSGKAVVEAFDRKYGIDIKKAGRLNHSHLEVEKIN
jgi:hypothetical protein